MLLALINRTRHLANQDRHRSIMEQLKRLLILAIIFLLFVFIISLFLVVTSEKLYLSGDNAIFASTSYYHHMTGNIANPLYNPLQGNLESLIYWHGWFMPWLQSIAMPKPEYQSFLYSCLFFTIITIFLYSFAMKKFSIWSNSAVLLITLSVLFYQWGRPELIISLLVSVFIAVRAMGIRNSIIDGSLLGLCFCTSPTAAVTLGLIWSQVALFEKPFIKAVRDGTVSFVTAVTTVLVLSTSIAEFNVLKWFIGILEHATIIGSRENSGSFFRYYFWAPEFPGLIFSVILVSILAWKFAAKMDWLQITLLMVLVIWVASRLTSPYTVYNFIFLIPPAVYVATTTSIFASMKNGQPIGIRMALALVLVLSSFSTLRATILNLDLALNGAGAQEMAALISKLPSKGVLQTSSLSVAANLTFAKENDSNRVEFAGTSSSRYRIDTQAFTGRLSPLLLNACERVIINKFHTDRPSLFGIPLGRTHKDWAFAIVEDTSREMAPSGKRAPCQ